VIDAAQCGEMISPLVSDEAKHVQAVEMRGLQLQNLLIELLGFAQKAGAMERQRLRKGRCDFRRRSRGKL
jgi:hypothetical protein